MHIVIITLSAGNTIHPCNVCCGCVGKGNCVFGDDTFQELYTKMVEADGIAFGSLMIARSLRISHSSYFNYKQGVCSLRDQKRELLESLIQLVYMPAKGRYPIQCMDRSRSYYSAGRDGR